MPEPELDLDQEGEDGGEPHAVLAQSPGDRAQEGGSLLVLPLDETEPGEDRGHLGVRLLPAEQLGRLRVASLLEAQRGEAGGRVGEVVCGGRHAPRRLQQPRLGAVPAAAKSVDGPVDDPAVGVGDGELAQPRILLDPPAPVVGSHGIAGALAGGQHGADGLGPLLGVADLSGGHRHHHLVEEREALVDLSLADERQAPVAERPQLQLVVAELPGESEGELGALGQLPRVVVLTARPGDGEVAALDARLEAVEEAERPLLPAPRRGDLTEGLPKPGEEGRRSDGLEELPGLDEGAVSPLHRPARPLEVTPGPEREAEGLEDLAGPAGGGHGRIMAPTHPLGAAVTRTPPTRCRPTEADPHRPT